MLNTLCDAPSMAAEHEKTKPHRSVVDGEFDSDSKSSGTNFMAVLSAALLLVVSTQKNILVQMSLWMRRQKSFFVFKNCVNFSFYLVLKYCRHN